MYKHILIATDGSELAEKGLAQGLDLAAGLGAEVTVVTVTEPTVPVATATSAVWIPTFDPAELDKAKAESARRILDASTAFATGRGATVKPLHVTGRYPAEGIVETASEIGADLIVLTSHGRRGLGRLILGSQALEVLTASKIPVLVVK